MADTQPPPQSMATFLERAARANLQAEYVAYTQEQLDRFADDEPGYLSYEMRNGRDTRRLRLEMSGVERLLGTNFESQSYLGDLNALVDFSSGTIEARVVSSIGPVTIGGLNMRLEKLPGVEIFHVVTGGHDRDESDIEEPEDIRKELKLVVRDEGVAVELGTLTNEWLLARYGPVMGVGLRITGLSPENHDAALGVLNRLGGAFLFDLDVVHNVSLRISPKRRAVKRISSTEVTKPPEFPRNEYASDALALYEYGRSSEGLPLLEFLAYYQALEYFFPSFMHRETAASIQRLLRNPRFDATDDSAINKVIQLASPAGRSGVAERTQIRASLLACTEEEGLREMVRAVDPKEEHFVAKKQTIKGVTALRLQDPNLREQVADRIYNIRCRIVHTKQDGGSTGDELLLPTGREAAALVHEIALLRLIAQEAIIQQAKTRSR